MRRTLSWASVESKSQFAVKAEAEVVDIAPVEVLADLARST
jgi:hypothetical protein